MLFYYLGGISQYMDDSSKDITFNNDSLNIIFIGKHKSTSEIHIDRLPTWHDVLYFMCKKNNQDLHLNRYKYINLTKDKMIYFQYEDGIRKNRGRILYYKHNLTIILDEPIMSICNYFLIQKGNIVTFLSCPPYNKIKLGYKDSWMICAEKMNIPIA